MSTPLPAVALRNLRRVQVAAAIISCFALGAALVDSTRLAVAAIVAALLLNILAIDAIRVVVANLRGISR